MVGLTAATRSAAVRRDPWSGKPSFKARRGADETTTIAWIFRSSHIKGPADVRKAVLAISRLTFDQGCRRVRTA
jgi:hypothetical protein